MKILLHDTPEAIGEHLATRILAELRAANATGRPYVLGCPGGRSPMPVYQALERQLAANPVDCSGLIVAMMDEYLLSSPDGLSPAARARPLFLPRFWRAGNPWADQPGAARGVADAGGELPHALHCRAGSL